MYSNPYDSYLRTLTNQLGVVPAVQPDNSMAYVDGKFGGASAQPQAPIDNMNLQVGQQQMPVDQAPSVAGAKVARAPGEHSTTQKLLHALLGTSFGIGG